MEGSGWHNKILYPSDLLQRWDGPVQEIREGDTVWIPPHVKHWHGASPGSAMSHIAVVEHLHGEATEWMEPVSDEQSPGERD